VKPRSTSRWPEPATASTEASGAPASNAIDGSASTDWCSTEWTGSLTVDPGRVRALDGFGVTLGDTSTTALVNISYGTTAGSMTPVPGAQQQSVPADEPVCWPSGHGLLKARYVQIDVTDNDGTPPCIGEFRLFAPEPMNAIPDRGADLSLTLFSFTGQALPSVGLFQNPVGCARGMTRPRCRARCPTVPQQR
jgi:hypothetical protein